MSVNTRPLVGILDYGVGNIGSLSGALSRLGYRTNSGKTADDLAACDALILPGVGAMAYAMNALKQGGMAEFIRHSYLQGDKPIIGICLGMQLMFEHSQEGDVDALGLLPGHVRRLPQGTCHVGWNLCASPVGAAKGSRSQDWPQAAFYFNHSYYIDCHADIVTSYSHLHGLPPLPAIVQSRSFTGLQFHPEKSQVAGADLLRHLIEGDAYA